MSFNPEIGSFEPIKNPFDNSPFTYPFFLFYKNLSNKPEFIQKFLMPSLTINEIKFELTKIKSSMIDRLSSIVAGKYSLDTGGVILLIPGQIPYIEPLVDYAVASFGLREDEKDTNMFSPYGKSRPAFLQALVTPFDTKAIHNETNNEAWVPALQIVTNRRDEPYDLYTRVLQKGESCKRIVLAKKIA